MSSEQGKHKERSLHGGRRVARRASWAPQAVLLAAMVVAVLLMVVLGERMLFWQGQAARQQQELDRTQQELNRAQQDQASLRIELDRLQQNNASLQEQLAQNNAPDLALPSTPPDHFPDDSQPTLPPLEDDPYPELYAQEADTGSLAPGRTIYLTFDDGPSSQTEKILDILKENDIKATFFVVGQTSRLAQDMMKRIVDEGHTLGIHTYSHDYKKIYASVDAYLEDFNRIYQWIYEVTGVYPQVFRFAGGSVNGYNRSICTELFAEMDRRGFVHYDWNSVNGDAEGVDYTVDEMVGKALNQVGVNRVILLMHDSVYKAKTVEALQAIIDGYRNAGYSFDRLTPEVKTITFH